jgi:hypothetical protein
VSNELQNAELLALKTRKVALARRRIELIKQYGLAYYRPHPKQDAFHRAGVKFKRRMVRAGNRFGKSQMGCTEDVSWLIGERTWLPESDPARRGGIPQHPIKLLTITTDWDKVDEIWTGQRGEGGKVWKYLPYDLVKSRRRNHSGAIDTIELRNGSLWRFDTVKSYMANPQGSESSDWDAVHVDEPCPEKMWTAVSRGLIDRGGSAWFTLTPLTEFWINDFFFPQDTGGKIRDNVWAIGGSTYDNPYLPPEAIREFEATLNDEERQCRLHGVPLHLAGLIYKQFDWANHVLTDIPKGWELYTKPPKDWTYYFYIDPHPQTPHAVQFWALGPDERAYCYADIFKHCAVYELAELIKEMLDGRTAHWAKMDPLGFINDPITETNMAIELADHGVYVEKATKALAHGILKVQGELKKRDIFNKPTVMFAPSAGRTLWEIQRYCWDEEENKPIDKDDHMMENMYRAILSEMRYVKSNPYNVPIGDIEIPTRLDLSLGKMNYNEI